MKIKTTAKVLGTCRVDLRALKPFAALALLWILALPLLVQAQGPRGERRPDVRRGSSVPGSCTASNPLFYKNSATEGLYVCVGGTYVLASPSGGSLGGSGTANKLSRFTAATTLGNSHITDDDSVGITISAPDGSTGGALAMNAGASSVGVGGTVSLTAGSSASMAGGSITITGGAGTTTGGDVTVSGGAGGSGAAGKPILVSPVIKGLTVVTLTDAATIATDASLANHFRVTLGGNRTLGNPTNPTDGQKVVWEVIQDGDGNRTLAYDTQFTFGTDVASCTVSTTASKRDFIGAIYNSTATKWYVTSCVRGY